MEKSDINKPSVYRPRAGIKDRMKEGESKPKPYKPSKTKSKEPKVILKKRAVAGAAKRKTRKKVAINASSFMNVVKAVVEGYGAFEAHRVAQKEKEGSEHKYGTVKRATRTRKGQKNPYQAKRKR